MKLIRAIIFLTVLCSCSIGDFEIRTVQKPIDSSKGIDDVLSKLESIDYDELSEAYKKETGHVGAYIKMVKNGTFYRLNETDTEKYIVGRIKIGELVSHDDNLFNNWVFGAKSYQHIWLIDKELLYKILELQNELAKRGYNSDGFQIKNGHRHPTHNSRIGGAKKSQHIAGKAVDIVVLDINRDGKSNQSDKEIVLEILEEKVIRNKGGIGRYPGTMVVHFDVRGKKARWDSY